MKIAATSDLHGILPSAAALPDADILIIAGDLCPDLGPPKQEAWLKSTFAQWVASDAAKYRHILLIWGNHDFIGERRLPLTQPPLPDKVTLLFNNTVVIDGISFYGTPYVTGLPGWAFNVRENIFLKRMKETIPDEGVDVFITHSPPLLILDRDADDMSMHFGSAALQSVIKAMPRPQLHIFGHVHEGRGSVDFHHNVAYVDRRYEPYGKPIPVFNVEARDGDR